MPKQRSRSILGKNTEIETGQKRKKRLFSGFLVILVVIIGVGIIVNNISEIYMMDKNTATATTPYKVIRNTENAFLVTTYSQDGTPASDQRVEVDLKYEGKTYELYSGKTDSSGSVQPILRVPEIGKEGDTAELVIKAGSETITKKVRIDTTTKIFISTDKPIYQPLQTIHIRALVFEGEVPYVKENGAQIEIQDLDGNKIFRQDFTPNEFGIINHDFQLSDQFPMGNYKIIVNANGATEKKSVLVKEYVLPKFKIELEDIRSWYTIKEDISGNLSCNYFFGKEVDGDVQILVRSYYGVWETVESISGKLVNGKFNFEIKAVEYSVGIPYNTDNGILEVNVTVTDSGGHKETKSKIISIARKPIILTLLADSNVVGTISNHYLLARYPDGMPVVNAKVSFRDSRRSYYDSDNKKITYTDSRGIANIQYKFENQYYLSVEVDDKNTTVAEKYYIYGSKGLKVIPDKTNYLLGEQAQLEVVYTGDSGVTKWVYYDVVSKGFVVTTGHFKLDNNKASFKLPITSDMAPLAEIRVYKTQKDLNVVNDVAIIGVSTAGSDLNVSIQTDQELYSPNDNITLQFSVSENGAPVHAALGLAFVDQSVFEIHERFTGFEKIIQGLDEEFITPQYQIINYVYSPSSPINAIPEESTSIVSQQGLSSTGTGTLLVTSGTSHQDYSEQLEGYYVGYYWFILLIIGLIGFLGLVILAFKYRAVAAVVVFLLFFLPVLMMMGMLMWTSSLTGPSETGKLANDRGDVAMEETGWDGDGDSDDSGNWLRADPPLAKSESSTGGLQGMGGLDIDINVPSLPGDGDGTSGVGDMGTTSSIKEVKIRQYFPETWYWNPSIITDNNGAAELKLTVPDSMTTWNVEAVASTKDMQFGLGTKNITVFQGFFIEPDIPVSVVRNDEFPLKILIYNYADHSVNTTVTLHQEDWYQLLNETNIQSIQVGENSVSSVDFHIRAKEVGKFNITVDGDNGVKVDRVIKELKVVPDGKLFDELVNGMLENNQSVNSTITFQKDGIPNSTNAYVKLQGGIEAVTLDGADSFIRFVSGCGEQSTSRLSLTVSAYKNAIKGSYTDEQLFEWESKVSQGIEHESQYLTDVPESSGKAISWYSGKKPDLWLTAWAIFVYKDLEDVGFEIDADIIPGMQNYLDSQQQNDGSYEFPDIGHWSINSKLESEKLVSTAYITRALLYSGYDKESTKIAKSVTYIEDNLKFDDDPYTLALVLLTLEQAEGNTVLCNDLAKQLVDLRHEDEAEGTVAWSWAKAEEHNYDHRHGGATVIETTGYAIMALKETGGYTNVIRKAVKYLLTRRSGGCYSTTHDTAVAFQALNTIDEISINDLTVTIMAENKVASSIQFTEYNKDITYLIDLRPFIDDSDHQLEVQLISNGDGSIAYQICSEQYLPWNESELEKPPELELNVTYNTTSIRVNDKIVANVFLKYNGASSKLRMVLIDLRAPVGFSFVDADFIELENNGVISFYEINERQASIYIENVLKDKEIKFSYSLLANAPIRGTLQGVHAYDMYDSTIDTELGPVEIESFV